MTNPNAPPPAKWRRCACCDKYAEYLTPRGFCRQCERELRDVIEAVNETERKAQ